MTTITLMKQQLQEMNVGYWQNFLFPKIIKLGEEPNVNIAKPRQAGGGNQPESVSEYYGKVYAVQRSWRSALQNVIDDLNLKFGPNQQHVILLQHLILGFVPAAQWRNVAIWCPLLIFCRPHKFFTVSKKKKKKKKKRSPLFFRFFL